jgi:hypothetical protein
MLSVCVLQLKSYMGISAFEGKEEPNDKHEAVFGKKVKSVRRLL